MRKPWRRKNNLIFSAVSGADATEHFSVFVIEGNEMINENDECGAWSRSSTNSLVHPRKAFSMCRFPMQQQSTTLLRMLLEGGYAN